MCDEEVTPLCSAHGDCIAVRMTRDFGAEHPGVLGTEKGDTFWSQSLAINPEQTEEHRRLFPDVRIAPDGQLGFDSVKLHSDYCDQTGFDKKSQRKEII